MARMQVPLYMFEGVGSMNMVDAIETKMLREFSRKLDDQGITDRGIRVPAGSMEGLGSLGAFKLGKNLRNLAATIAGKSKSKAKKAVSVAKAADAQSKAAVKRIVSMPSTVVNSDEKKVLAATVKAAQAIKKQALKDAAAPTLTKKEIIDAARPQIRAAAVAAASGAQKGVSAVMKKRGWASGWGRSPRKVRSNEIVQRQVSMSPLLPLNEIPASSYEDTPASNYEDVDVSGFGDVGADITSGADAFGADVSSGADAFGADVSSGADAFGADVSSGADAFGLIGADAAAEAGLSPISLAPGSKGYTAIGGSGGTKKAIVIGGLIVGGLLLAKKLVKR